MTIDFDKGLFASRIGHPFRVLNGPAAPVEVELITVTRLDAPEPRPFSVHFRGPAAPVLPQRTYRLEHDDLEPFDLFVVPIGTDREGRVLYEAVFN